MLHNAGWVQMINTTHTLSKTGVYNHTCWQITHLVNFFAFILEKFTPEKFTRAPTVVPVTNMRYDLVILLINFGTSHPLPPYIEGGGKSAPPPESLKNQKRLVQIGLSVGFKKGVDLNAATYCRLSKSTVVASCIKVYF